MILQEVHQCWAYEIGRNYSLLHFWQEKASSLYNVFRAIHAKPALGKHIPVLDLPL